MKRRHFMISTAMVLGALSSAPAFADALSDAKAIVAKYPRAAWDKWDGPTTGPKAQAGKKIVIVAADMKNGVILGVVNGIQEAAKAVARTVTGSWIAAAHRWA